MIAAHCPRELEVLEAVNTGRWPHSVGNELREHAGDCSDCRETVAVASALILDRRALEANVSVPPSGAVWWRMQMRRERDVREAAARAVRRVHAVVISAVIIAIATAVLMTPLLRRGAFWLFDTARGTSASLAAAPLPATTLIVLAAVAWLVFTPVVLYLAVARD
jgi:predicted anti-sigma-YlaC factor YlaD